MTTGIACRNRVCVVEYGRERETDGEVGHGRVTVFQNDLVLVASFHPSQQNTQADRLIGAIFRQIFDVAGRYPDANSGEPTTG
ncbi:MAG TPA: hypothetical protein VN494_05105 [Patescibacteria group bacterium]|nr:hypothetical protein [Patescibacteria group bacterium]